MERATTRSDQWAPAGNPHAAPLRLGILGATPGTGNLGIDALASSVVQGLLSAFPHAQLLFQAWSHSTPVTFELDGYSCAVQPLVIRNTRTLRSLSGLTHLRAMAQLKNRAGGLLAPVVARLNRTFGLLQQCDAILDISAGDSFADIYGEKVFLYQTGVKQLILEMGVPLILLPQTYGPFVSKHARETAVHILNRATLIATREEHGAQEIHQWCGGPCSTRVVTCPDVAFLLRPQRVAEEREPFLKRRGAADILVGINVSGLLYLSRRDFQLQADYQELVAKITTEILQQPHTRVLLIPHVIGSRPPTVPPRPGNLTRDVTDTLATHIFLERLQQRYPGRIACLNWPYTAGQTKYLIGQCDFFVGARMHSCIAAVSQCIPCCTMAYSKKAAGLMDHLGIGDTVVDLRQQDCVTAVQAVMQMYEQRARLQQKLSEVIPPVQRQVQSFFETELRAKIGDLAAH